jgi:predicted nucleotidyltransferase
VVERTWDDATRRHNAANTDAIYDLAKQVLGNQACVSKQGSSRKKTDTVHSDLDLMVDMAMKTSKTAGLRMTNRQREDFAAALRRLSQVKDVHMGPTTIKVTPHHGARIDLVSHHSDFDSGFAYLHLPSFDLFEWPSGQTAVRALKLWAHAHSNLKMHKIPGIVWEEMVLSLRQKPIKLLTGQATDEGDEGLDLFERALDLFTIPDLQAKRHAALLGPASKRMYGEYRSEMQAVRQYLLLANSRP